MVINMVFLVLSVIALIRTVSYGIYCAKRDITGGIGVFALAVGIVFCGFMIIF